MSSIIQIPREDQVNLRIVDHLDKQSLPNVLQEMLSLASTPDEEDILLLSTLTGASACIPNIYFRYGPTGKRYYANMQLFVLAPPASGKGIAGLAKEMVDVVDAQHPLMIPGDSTYPSWFNAMYNQHGLGYMHESEGSVITDIWGASVMSYNTALRKAAEHETISKNRVMTGKMVIERPKFSMLLTGTFDQYKKLVPSVENGYFSRLLTLFVQSTYPFDKKYVTTISAQSAIPEKIGNKLLDLHELMSMDEEKEWTLTQEQKEMLGEHLETEYKTMIMMLGENFHSTVVSMDVQIERIAMILSAMRGNLEVCSDEDFLTALMIGNKLLQHMAMAYKLINGDAQRAVPDIKPLDQRRILFKQLKEEYDHKTLVDEAKVQGVSKKTAERWNSTWMELGQVKKLSHGQYRKVA